MNDAFLYRLLIATIYAGLVLAFFGPTSSSKPTTTAAVQTPANHLELSSTTSSQNFTPARI